MYWFCHKMGCWKMTKNRYCVRHECRNRFCRNGVVFDHFHCFFHKCQISFCPNPSLVNFSYCLIHKCNIEECENPAMTDPFTLSKMGDMCVYHENTYNSSSVFIR